MPQIASLPDRPRQITAGLPDPFRRAQLDGTQPAFALTPAGPVVSTDAWSGRQLAAFTGDRWTRITAGTQWHCRPDWSGEHLVSEVFDDLAGERARSREIPLTAPAEGIGPAQIVSRATPHERALTHPSLSGVALSPRAAVQAVAPNSFRDDRVAILLTQGSARRVVCADGGGTTHWDGPVTSIGPWLSEDELVLVVESWPGRTPYAWDVRSGARRRLVETAGVVVGDVRAEGELAGLSWTSGEQPRRLHLVPVADLRAGRRVRLLPDPPAGDAPPPPRATVLAGPNCPLPCIVRDPHGDPRGTVLLLHGGPNGANLATWSPLAESLALAGWRVVQPNLRGSGVLDPALRPPAPERYGVHDAEDVRSVLRQLGTGPVVVGGVSYGGYLAARTARIAPEVRGVFVICGFLRSSDLDGSDHDQVRAFLRVASDRFAPEVAFAQVPHFVAHGEKDPRIPAEAVHAHLGDLPPGSEWVGIEDEGHGMLTDYAARRVFPRFFSWLDRIDRIDDKKGSRCFA
ncbi:alpha/beta fold hydrolase [Streptosporangium soli]|nr:alpha/beta fold hydrolase [Streptosporangium sp. KLBMP 9127]